MTEITNTASIPDCMKQFVSYFENLKQNQETQLTSFYSDNVVFQDPIHHIKSLQSLVNYFAKLNQNLNSGGFQFTSIRVHEGTCYLEWIMNIELRRPNKKVSASGISVLSFEDKITHHRDYFDAGEVFYENVPLLGGVIRFLKKKLTNS